MMNRTFRMPAEWEPHRVTWIAWPHQREDWPAKFEPIPWVYTEIVRHLAASEQVGIVANEELANEARQMLRRVGVDLGRITFAPFATDRVWMRDSGPIFVYETGNDTSRLVALDWHFNAWAKYDNYHHDDRLPEELASFLGLERIQPDWHGRRLVLEGGAIDVDGQGLLLTTEECLLDQAVQVRNPGLSRADLEAALRTYLGVRDIIWLHRGIVGDDTHGHVDDLTRFVAPGTVVTAIEPDRGDVNHDLLAENLERLRAFRDSQGRGLRIHTLPMPSPIVFDGQRVPASYANFFIANDRVLVPTFNDAQDRHALNKLAELFPTRQVVGIHAVDLVWGLGTLHCLTQQEPAA
ncbi:MAG: agmatine deiminase family protein [Gemmataceae bacterium]